MQNLNDHQNLDQFEEANLVESDEELNDQEHFSINLRPSITQSTKTHKNIVINMGNSSSATHTVRPSMSHLTHIGHQDRSQGSSFINNIQTTPTQPFFHKAQNYRSTKTRDQDMRRQGSETMKTVVRTNQYRDLDARVSQKRRSASRGSCDIVDTKEDYPSQ